MSRRLGATLDASSNHGFVDGVGAVAEEDVSGGARPARRRRAASGIPAEKIERQRASRLAQLVQQRENPDNATASRVTAGGALRRSHPYGFTELGTEDAVKAVTRDDMQAFWKQNFVPNNAALVVAGDITMAELKPLAEKAFGAWPKGTPGQPALGAPDDDDRARRSSWTSPARRRRSCASRPSARRDRRPTTRRSR